MMKQFRVVVNGTEYQVEVEEITESSPKTSRFSVATENLKEDLPSAADVQSISPGKEVIAPMPGTILSVKKSQGDEIKVGEALCVLEAMKMENDIVSPIDGKIQSILVKVGDTVQANDVIALIG